MERRTAPLEAVRAVGRLGPDGPWVGFGYRAGRCRLVVGSVGGMQDAGADAEELLAVAIGYFAGAFDEAPPDIEATQSDLFDLVRTLMSTERNVERRARLAEAVDAIDDGLAGDAVAAALEAARSPRTGSVDPVELLARKVREIAAGD